MDDPCSDIFRFGNVADFSWRIFVCFPFGNVTGFSRSRTSSRPGQSALPFRNILREKASKCVWSSASPLEMRGGGLPTTTASRMDDEHSGAVGVFLGLVFVGTLFLSGFSGHSCLPNALFPVGLYNETQGTIVPLPEWHWKSFRYPHYAVLVYVTQCTL